MIIDHLLIIMAIIKVQLPTDQTFKGAWQSLAGSMIESFAPGEFSTLLIKRQAIYQMKGVCKNKLLKLFNLFDFL